LGISTYIVAAKREEFSTKLQAAEDWLYDNIDGEKQIFIDKIGELKPIGDPVEFRHREAEGRKDLQDRAKTLFAACRTKAGECAQLDPANVKALEDMTSATESWLKGKQADQFLMKPHEEPVYKCAEVTEKLEELKKVLASVKSAEVNVSPQWEQPSSSPVPNEIEID